MGELKITLNAESGQTIGDISLKLNDRALKIMFNKILMTVFNSNSEGLLDDVTSTSKTNSYKEDSKVDSCPPARVIRNNPYDEPRNILAPSDRDILLREGSSGYVTQKCPECNHIFNGLAKSGSSFKCYNCEEEFTTPGELIKVDYVCPYCDSKGYGYTPKHQDIKSIHCRSCKAPIDIVYVKKLGKIISANLAK